MPEQINYRLAWQFPVVYNDVHESLYRSYHILGSVKNMLRRGDIPTDMILHFIELMGSKHAPDNHAPNTERDLSDDELVSSELGDGFYD